MILLIKKNHEKSKEKIPALITFKAVFLPDSCNILNIVPDKVLYELNPWAVDLSLCSFRLKNKWTEILVPVALSVLL